MVIIVGKELAIGVQILDLAVLLCAYAVKKGMNLCSTVALGK